MKTENGWELQQFQRSAGWPFIEDMTYPQLSATMEFELKVRSDQTDSPEGCILVEKVVTPNADPMLMRWGRFTPRREQFWLDTNRDYALVKHVSTDVEASEAECRAIQRPRHTEYHYSDFEQSPNGVWYPTKIKVIGAMVARETDPVLEAPDAVYWTAEVEFAEAYPRKLFDIDAAKKRSP